VNHDAIATNPLPYAARHARAAGRHDIPGWISFAGMPVVYRKLVRDRIPEIIQSQGRHPVTRVLDDAGYREALLSKLVEEAREASHATPDDLPGELADVLEVLRALTTTAGLSWPQLLSLAEDKLSRRGGFGRRIFLESVE
jgi:predicted house-cleaning noncanonical NTP pyrophosphatase (MazG superfamily)